MIKFRMSLEKKSVPGIKIRRNRAMSDSVLEEEGGRAVEELFVDHDRLSIVREYGSIHLSKGAGASLIDLESN